MKVLKKTIGLLIIMGLYTSLLAQNQALPTDMRDGRCYLEATNPSEYKLTAKKILVQQSYTKVVTKPAVYDTFAVGVIAFADSKEIIADAYDFEIVTKPNYDFPSDVSIIDNVYEFETKNSIKESIARSWDLSNLGMCDSPAGDCDLLDWIILPVNYIPKNAKSEGKSEEKGNQLTSSVAIINLKFSGQDKIVPVEYRFYVKEVLLEAAEQEVIQVPAKYQTISERVQINEKPSTQWVEVVCSNKVDGFLIGQIQLSLKGRKFYYGKINGSWNDYLQTALENYQVENNLPVGKLDKLTVESLGLNYEMLIDDEKSSNYNDLEVSTK